MKYIILFLWICRIFCAGKCLLISVDNRNMSTNINDNQYWSISAVINQDYAAHHGYDFYYVQNVVTNVESEANAKYPNDYVIPPTNIAKDVATAFHVGLKQFRAASWAKLPPIWHVIATIGSQYEYIWYIDSDASISPLHRNRTIEQSVAEWEKNNAVLRGNPKVTQSAFIFFSNKPWRDDMPCAGSFLFRPSLAEPVIREWWDFDLPSKNFKHFHEQDALWHMIEAEAVDKEYIAAHPHAHFKMNSSTFSIVTEQQFPSSWKRYEELWLCHVASYNYLVRDPILYQFLKMLNKDSEANFKLAIENIIANHTLPIHSVLAVTERMEELSSRDKHRIVHFPVHNEKTQFAWYDEHVTTKGTAMLSTATMLEGRLIRHKRSFWLVCNGTKYGFGNYDAFISRGFYNQLAFQVNAVEANELPSGDDLGAPCRTIATPHPCDNSVLYTKLNSVTPSTTYVICAETSGSESGTAVVNKGVECDVDAQLEALVITNHTRSILYLISHDNDSEHLAHKFAACKEGWMRPIKIHSTVFFESIMYRENLPALRNEWEAVDYVITATYKTVAKQLHYNGFNQNMAMIRQLLEVAQKENYDIVPFLRSGSGTISFVTYWHGEVFKKAWDALLTAMGYSVELIKSLDEVKPFYRNIFIIKTTVLKGLIEFMSKAMNIVETNEHVRVLFQQNANYKEGQVEVAMRIFGTSYYQLHPFIFERLPSFYLHSINAKICHYAGEGPCKFNT